MKGESGYYHFYPQCPSCTEPSLIGTPLNAVDNNGDEEIKCTGCDAVFRSRVDLTQYVSIKDAVMRRNTSIKSDHLKQVPLIWKINLNPVERAYMEWVPLIREGRYLITWPWREVRFIPLLVSEYMRKNPESKVAVVGKVSHSDGRNWTLPDASEAFRYLLKAVPGETDDIERKDLNSFNEKAVLKKKRMVHFTIRNRKTNEVNEGSIPEEETDATKCKNRLKKEIMEFHGENSIRKISWETKKGRKKEETIQKKGTIDISVNYREEWTGNRKLRYDTRDLVRVLINADSIRRTSKDIPSITVTDDGELHGDIENYRVAFISNEMSFEKIEEHIDGCSPDLIIFMDSDSFVQKKLYDYGEYRKFYRFLKSSDRTLLMFSCSPDIRHLYGDGGINGIPSLSLHTWDTDIVIKKLKELHETSGISSVLSSSMNDIRIISENHDPEYVQVPELDKIEDISKLILSKLGDRDTKEYLSRITMTVLPIRGEECYSWNRWTLDNILNALMESEKCETDEIVDQFDDVYSIRNGKNINPLMEKISEIICEYREKYDRIYVAVSKPEKRFTERRLKESFYDGVEVFTWDELLHRYSREESTVLIAASWPSINFPVSECEISKFIFVGSSRNLDRIKKIFENRAFQQHSRPVYKPDRRAPGLLLDLTSEVNVPDKIFSESPHESREDWEDGETVHTSIRSEHRRTLKPGSRAVLITDDDGRGIFLPPGRYLFFKEPGKKSIRRLKADISGKEDLKGKELIVDEHGFYTSFRNIFISLMLDYGDNITIKKSYMEWKGFRALVEDAFEWLKKLRKCVFILSDAEGISRDEAADIISSELVDTGINAKDPKYIRTRWLSDPEKVYSGKGSVEVFEIEHPKGVGDLERIYMYMSERFPEAFSDEGDAHRCYVASRTLQKFRKKFLSSEGMIKDEYTPIYNALWEEIKRVVDRSEKFRISKVEGVELKREVDSLKIIPDYADYVL